MNSCTYVNEAIVVVKAEKGRSHAFLVGHRLFHSGSHYRQRRRTRFLIKRGAQLPMRSVNSGTYSKHHYSNACESLHQISSHFYWLNKRWKAANALILNLAGWFWEICDCQFTNLLIHNPAGWFWEICDGQFIRADGRRWGESSTEVKGENNSTEGKWTESNIKGLWWSIDLVWGIYS